MCKTYLLKRELKCLKIGTKIHVSTCKNIKSQVYQMPNTLLFSIFSTQPFFATLYGIANVSNCSCIMLQHQQH